MQQYYDQILELTRQSTKFNYQKLTSEYNVLHDLIVQDADVNINAAAKNGHHHALIFAYRIDTKYKGISISDMFSDIFGDQLKECKLDPLVEKLQKKFNPFKVEHKILGESRPKGEDPISVAGIVISWPV